MKIKLFNCLLSISIIACLVSYSGCLNDCEPDREPKLIVNFSTSHDYTQVYGLKDVIQNIPSSSSTSWEIPISIVADETTVVFKSSTLSDTLTIRYKRNPKLESTRCGFRIFFNNLSVGEPTTFSDYYLSGQLDPYTDTITININE